MMTIQILLPLYIFAVTLYFLYRLECKIDKVQEENTRKLREFTDIMTKLADEFERIANENE